MSLIDRIVNVEQGTIDWFIARSGVLTASRMASACTPAKMGYAAGADTLINHLMAELFLPGAPEAIGAYTSREMQNGIDTEDEAKKHFGFVNDVDVVKVGFIKSECGRFGCSPDGLIVKNGEYVGGLELKCPQPHTHFGYLRDPDSLYAAYKLQVHGSLIVAGLPYWKLMSYFPGLPPVVLHVVPDDTTDKLREVLEIFWENWLIAKEQLQLMGVNFDHQKREPDPESSEYLTDEEVYEDLGM